METTTMETIEAVETISNSTSTVSTNDLSSVVDLSTAGELGTTDLTTSPVHSFWETITSTITPELMTKVLTMVIGLVVFYVVYFILKKILKKIFASNTKIRPHISSLVLKVVRYVFYILMTVYVLGIFGVKLTALFGAAGIAGVAIGFAAQTSFSNIVSGLFLLTEHAFKIGDFIAIGDTSGIIDSIDMLSIRIHTLDNQMIRIPNETIIKSNLQNNSFYPIRRVTVDVDVPYEVDLQKSLEVLAKVPENCPLVLTDPAPLVFCNAFHDSGVTVTLAVWLNTSDFIAVKNSVFVAILKVLTEAGIEIPAQQIDVHSVD